MLFFHSSKRAVVIILSVSLVCTLFMGIKLFSKDKNYRHIDRYNDSKIISLAAQHMQELERYRSALVTNITYIDNSSLFSKTRDAESYSREEKEYLWAAFQNFLDYIYMLDSLHSFYTGFEKIGKQKARDRAFGSYYATFLLQYRYSLEFINRIEGCSGVKKILNDGVPEYGIESGSYDALKVHYLNFEKASLLYALAMYNKLAIKEKNFLYTKRAKVDHIRIVELGKLKSMFLTVENSMTIIKNISKKITFPVQARFAEFAGDTKVLRFNRSLITISQIQKEILPKLVPGDILVERREWYVSNIGLPGFWSHAALYIGNQKERQLFFKNDPEVSVWVKSLGETSGDFELLLQKRYSQAYTALSKVDHQNHEKRIIEAMSEGVVFTALEHSADCDSLAVIRPKLNKLAIAAAILQALHYWNRPYDFNFDFVTDESLVCTELISKAYERSNSKEGLRFKGSTLLGKQVISANDIVRQFSIEETTANKQLSFILFYDGDEWKGRANISDISDFKKSWQRPKWHIIKEGIAL